MGDLWVGLAGALLMLAVATGYRRYLERHGPDNWRFSWTGIWRKLFARRE